MASAPTPKINAPVPPKPAGTRPDAPIASTPQPKATSNAEILASEISVEAPPVRKKVLGFLTSETRVQPDLRFPGEVIQDLGVRWARPGER